MKGGNEGGGREGGQRKGRREGDAVRYSGAKVKVLQEVQVNAVDQSTL